LPLPRNVRVDRGFRKFAVSRDVGGEKRLGCFGFVSVVEGQ